MARMTYFTDSKLRAFRLRIGKTSAEVGRACDVSQSTITRIELGDSAPQLETAIRILKWADVQAKRHNVPKCHRLEKTDLLPGSFV